MWSSYSVWRQLSPLDLAPDDPQPSVAPYTPGRFENVWFFARNRRGLLANVSKDDELVPLGGVLASAPAAAGIGTRVVAAALVNDHGRLGVWWKFWGGFTMPCTYNASDACATCGCDLAGTFRCDM